MTQTDAFITYVLPHPVPPEGGCFITYPGAIHLIFSISAANKLNHMLLTDFWPWCLESQLFLNDRLWHFWTALVRCRVFVFVFFFIKVAAGCDVAVKGERCVLTSTLLSWVFSLIGFVFFIQQTWKPVKLVIPDYYKYTITLIKGRLAIRLNYCVQQRKGDH